MGCSQINDSKWVEKKRSQTISVDLIYWIIEYSKVELDECNRFENSGALYSGRSQKNFEKYCCSVKSG